MLIRRLWAKPWRGLQHPPIASFTLMLLLCVFWLTGIRENLALVPSLLVRPSQAYRLVTYCLCHADAAQLLLSLLLFPLLGWRQELQQGTLRYLHASALGAAVSALLYLLLAGLWGAQPGSAVSGYTPVHLAMLGCQQRQSKQRHGSRWVPASLFAGLLLGLNQLLSTQSPFLLHLSGLLTCLASAPENGIPDRKGRGGTGGHRPRRGGGLFVDRRPRWRRSRGDSREPTGSTGQQPVSAQQKGPSLLRM